MRCLPLVYLVIRGKLLNLFCFLCRSKRKTWMKGVKWHSSKYMRVWQMVRTQPGLAWSNIILSLLLLKQYFPLQLQKKKPFTKGEDLWQLQNQRREEKEGRDLMSKSKPVSQSSADLYRRVCHVPPSKLKTVSELVGFSPHNLYVSTRHLRVRMQLKIFPWSLLVHSRTSIRKSQPVQMQPWMGDWGCCLSKCACDSQDWACDSQHWACDSQHWVWD